MNSTATQTDRFDVMRQAMVASQLRTNGVSDARVVAAMARVPREAYLPEDVSAFAYSDRAVPLPHSRAQNLPIATGKLLTVAELRADDRVLLIGAAGGYTAAVLAEIVLEVVAVEVDPVLAGAARTSLADYRTVTVVEGALEAGHAGHAPYDLLFVDGAVEQLPDALVAQVKAGGRVVAGLADRGVTRLAYGRRSEGGFALLPFADIECVVLPGFARPRSFTF
ncbi:MAG: protein-L-isoaspartate O-methyltransferase [Sphingomonas bacterium]|uniref:protein-L-isoaspartate O-methyltransferase family protein n=1 Tax=Sphingomonas bacterium TaxID=1895847 RepID=UPI002616559C|nr:protein-L-isoaspartate O-methyltransferase [Sphingomonas bacterium]MDB5708438.1 protein-L-isoaspartate O-methyltransferase [Sphingomonas bacterium]